jgi:hypothetical protein
MHAQQHEGRQFIAVRSAVLSSVRDYADLVQGWRAA